MGYILALASAALVCFVFYGDWVRLGSHILQAAAVASGAVFLAGMYARVSIWTKGGAGLMGFVSASVAGFFSPDCLLGRRLYREHKIRGVILAVTIWSFLALFAGTLFTSFEYTLRLDLTSSRIFSLVMDVSGAALLVTTAFYIVRRLVDRESRVIAVMEDHVLLWGLLSIVLTGFLLEGTRMAAYPDPEAAWSPAGMLASRLITAFVAGKDMPGLRNALYNLHAFIVFAFIAYIPFSKQFHMFAAQIVTARARESARERERLMHET